MIAKIKLSDENEYSVKVYENFGEYPEQFKKEEVEKYLTTERIFIQHDWNGVVLNAFPKAKVKTAHVSRLTPNDKGRPSVTLCNDEGYAVCAVCVYSDEKELAVYPPDNVRW